MTMTAAVPPAAPAGPSWAVEEHTMGDDGTWYVAEHRTIGDMTVELSRTVDAAGRRSDTIEILEGGGPLTLTQARDLAATLVHLIAVASAE